MTISLALWLVNLVLAALTLAMARSLLRLRVWRARRERLRFLAEAIRYLDQLPQSDAMQHAWRTILSRSTATARAGDPLISAIYALEHSYDSAVDALRDAVVPQVNLINQFAELVDEGLVRPRDIARLYPKLHLRLLRNLALIEPFVWYESIFQGRGRWGYRTLRLKTIFTILRPISPLQTVRSPLVLEVSDLFFLALPSVTAIERIWATARLSVRSPTITSRSKVAQVAQRSALRAKLRETGLTVRSAVSPVRAVDW